MLPLYSSEDDVDRLSSSAESGGAAHDQLRSVGRGPVGLRPPRLAAGGAGLVSTARDFLRFTAMLLGHGTLDGIEVLRAKTARLACSNLLPEGVVSDAGFGAGMRITKTHKDADRLSPGPAGTLSFGGAAGCRWMVDPVRRGMMVFMTQRMSGPANRSLWNDLHAAVDADLA